MMPSTASVWQPCLGDEVEEVVYEHWKSGFRPERPCAATEGVI